jgi:hypothetical protein
MRSQTTIFSAEQEAIIKSVCISKGKGATVIATDSLSTMMVVEGMAENEKADEAEKIALEEDINDRELYPPQDLIIWMKKTDAKNRHTGRNTMRFKKETRV